MNVMECSLLFDSLFVASDNNFVQFYCFQPRIFLTLYEKVSIIWRDLGKTFVFVDKSFSSVRLHISECEWMRRESKHNYVVKDWINNVMAVHHIILCANHAWCADRRRLVTSANLWSREELISISRASKWQSVIVRRKSHHFMSRDAQTCSCNGQRLNSARRQSTWRRIYGTIYKRQYWWIIIAQDHSQARAHTVDDETAR